MQLAQIIFKAFVKLPVKTEEQLSYTVVNNMEFDYNDPETVLGFVFSNNTQLQRYVFEYLIDSNIRYMVAEMICGTLQQEDDLTLQVLNWLHS